MKCPSVLACMLAVMMSGCSDQRPELVSPSPLCNVIAHPGEFVGQRITLAGIAQMYQHGSTLRAQDCPDHALELDMAPIDAELSESEMESSPGAQFFTKLATATIAGRGVAVSVTGRVVRTPDQPQPFAFRVESGKYGDDCSGLGCPAHARHLK